MYSTDSNIFIHYMDGFFHCGVCSFCGLSVLWFQLFMCRLVKLRMKAPRFQHVILGWMPVPSDNIATVLVIAFKSYDAIYRLFWQWRWSFANTHCRLFCFLILRFVRYVRWAQRLLRFETLIPQTRDCLSSVYRHHIWYSIFVNIDCGRFHFHDSEGSSLL